MPPQSNVDAIRVMTCHASKGLEFPCVIVAGQTLSQAPQGYQWLPTALQPPPGDDAKQSDSLFFVGATRAQRSLLVTYANTAGGTARSKLRGVTPLLNRWYAIHSPHNVDLSSAPAEREQAEIGAIWGGSPGGALAARTLDKSSCAIRTYLTDFLGVKFPVNDKPLYPIFYQTARFTMQLIISQAHEQGAPVSVEQAQQIFLEKWAENQVAEHPHHPLYCNLGITYVGRFALAYSPPPGAVEHLDLTVGEAKTNFPLRLDLVTHYRTADGASVAISFRPEPMPDEKKKDKGLLWSALDSKHRVPFVLLRLRDPRLRPFVFSGQDGVLYPYLWTTRGADFDKEAQRVLDRFGLLAQKVFVEQINPWLCDRCASRVACPHWMGAINGPH
jgi:hypothetical protein